MVNGIRGVGLQQKMGFVSREDVVTGHDVFDACNSLAMLNDLREGRSSSAHAGIARRFPRRMNLNGGFKASCALRISAEGEAKTSGVSGSIEGRGEGKGKEAGKSGSSGSGSGRVEVGGGGTSVRGSFGIEARSGSERQESSRSESQGAELSESKSVRIFRRTKERPGLLERHREDRGCGDFCVPISHFGPSEPRRPNLEKNSTPPVTKKRPVMTRPATTGVRR